MADPGPGAASLRAWTSASTARASVRSESNTSPKAGSRYPRPTGPNARGTAVQCSAPQTDSGSAFGEESGVWVARARSRRTGRHRCTTAGRGTGGQVHLQVRVLAVRRPIVVVGQGLFGEEFRGGRVTGKNIAGLHRIAGWSDPTSRDRVRAEDGRMSDGSGTRFAPRTRMTGMPILIPMRVSRVPPIPCLFCSALLVPAAFPVRFHPDGGF